MSIALCHGCFDVLHVGHLHHLQEARKFGCKTLVVSITSAKFIKKPGRPIFTDEERAAMLRALDIVDEVYVSKEETGAQAIYRFKPRFYVKGVDYIGVPMNAKEVVACAKTGAKIVFTKTKKYSSTEVIKRMRK